MYNNVVVYYFSGTGNAANAAKWIIETAKESGLHTELYPIDRFKEIILPVNKEGRALIGFCYPTHGFFIAPLMLKFIWNFPSLKNTDVFILNTRAGMKLSKLYTPGLSGLAQLFPALILLIKRYRIVGLQPLDLPSNWITIHPGLRAKVIDSIYVRCKNIIQQFTKKLLSGKNRYKGLLSLPLDLAVAPIALGYYFIGRFFLAKTFMASFNCNNCNLCIEECPKEAIKQVDNRPYWTFHCESCMRCMNHCPKKAINTPHLFVITLWYFCFTYIFPFVENMIAHTSLLYWNSSFVNLLSFLLSNMICFAAVWGTYRILQLFLRYKLVNHFFTYTSLTFYWRKYRAPNNY